MVAGGSNRKVHTYSEEKATQMYLEIGPGELLPQFCNTFPSMPLWTDMAMQVGYTATGCEFGQLVVTFPKLRSPASLQTWYNEFDGPLIYTRLFSMTHPVLHSPSCLTK